VNVEGEIVRVLLLSKQQKREEEREEEHTTPKFREGKGISEPEVRGRGSASVVTVVRKRKSREALL